MTAPRLDDPAELAAYRAELRHVARGTRTAGMALAFVGVLVALLRGSAWPWIPKAVPVTIIALALGLMVIGIVRRARYHLKRLREL